MQYLDYSVWPEIMKMRKADAAVQLALESMARSADEAESMESALAGYYNNLAATYQSFDDNFEARLFAEAAKEMQLLSEQMSNIHEAIDKT